MNKILEYTRRPDVTFHRCGRIRIASRIARRLDITPGDSINVAISGGEYLLYAVHHPASPGRHHAACYRANRSGESYCANSVALCRRLLDAIGFPDLRAAFMVGEAVERGGITYFPIITTRPLC